MDVRSRLVGLAASARRHLIAIVALLALAGIHLAREPRTSPTTDEHGHVIRGLAYWWAPDTRLSWPHPPLSQALQALPSALVEKRFDFAKKPGFSSGTFTRVTRDYVSKHYADSRRLLRWSRLSGGVVSIAIGAVLYAWARRRFGRTTAVLALLAYAFNPILIAHAGLATNDFAIAGGALLALMALDTYLRDTSRRGFVLLALAVAALPVIKLSGVLVIALLGAISVVYAVRGKERFAGLPFGKRLLTIALHWAAIGVFSIFVVNLCYRFHETGLTIAEIIDHPEPESWIKGPIFGEKNILSRLPQGLRIPLPYTFIFGVAFIGTQDAMGHSSWFFGEASRGTFGYFPIMLAMKLPSGLIALLAVGLVLVVRARRIARREIAIAFWFAAGFLLLTLNSKINIGVRHALPVVPCLALLGARSAALALEASAAWMRWAARALSASLALGIALGFHEYIGDFNWLVGGRARGHRVSVVGEDWGQDLYDFARAAEARQITEIAYSTHHSLRKLELDALGIEVHDLKCSGPEARDRWQVVHITDWVRDARCFKWLRKREPTFVVNDHVLAFEPSPAR